MKIWINSDLHLGHQAIIEYEHRPKNFEKLIIENHNKVVLPDDVVFILGDICFGPLEVYQQLYQMNGIKYLVRGSSHDKKSFKWYLEHGFSFVCDSFSLKIYGLNLLFTHVPQPINRLIDFNYNIHGHLHSKTHHPECIINEKHILYSPELEDYKPIELKPLIDRHEKKLKKNS